MSVLVTDKGFSPLPELPSSGVADLAHTDDPAALDLAGLTLIRVHVPAFSDGRGFTIGRRLRMLGYTGELRAVGPMGITAPSLPWQDLHWFLLGMA